MEQRQWEKFPGPDYVRNFGFTTLGVHCLLIYDRNKENLVGFADANQFANELLAYQHSGLQRIVDKAINKRGIDITHVQQYFPSVSKNVLQDTQMKPLVKRMINEQIPEAMALKNGRPYLLQLEKVIKLAATN
jgi:hypothetical protein